MSNQTYASAVRSATFTGDDNKKVPGNKGCTVVLNVTAVPTVDTVTLSIQGKDPASGTYFTLLSAVARVAAGQDVLTIYPGQTESANVDAATALPDIYRVVVTHSAGSAFTYSIGVIELP
jgi:hypothetical protein